MKYIFEMHIITVLDFETGRVCQYDISKEDWNPDYEPCEEYLTHKGHNLSNCEWMVHENPQIIIE